MLATVVSLRLLRFISEAPLLVFVFTEAPKRKRDGENRSKHLFYRTRGSKEDSTTFDEPCLYTKKADKAFWLVKTIWFLFVDKFFCSIGKSSTFEDFILIPTGPKSFG